MYAFEDSLGVVSSALTICYGFFWVVVAFVQNADKKVSGFDQKIPQS